MELLYLDRMLLHGHGSDESQVIVGWVKAKINDCTLEGMFVHACIQSSCNAPHTFQFQGFMILHYDLI